MASIPDSTIPAIDAQAAALASGSDAAPVSPVSAEEKLRLEALLKNRADVKELQDKNILKSGSNLAPSLAAAQAELQKHQLEDKLEGRLGRRPERDELVERGILKDPSVAPALQGPKAELERSQLEDRLEKEIASRPDVEALKAKGILQE